MFHQQRMDSESKRKSWSHAWAEISATSSEEISASSSEEISATSSEENSSSDTSHCHHHPNPRYACPPLLLRHWKFWLRSDEKSDLKSNHPIRGMLWTQNTDLYEADNTDDNVQLDWSGCGMLETSGRGEGNRSIRHQNCLSQITVHSAQCTVHTVYSGQGGQGVTGLLHGRQYIRSWSVQLCIIADWYRAGYTLQCSG